MRKVLFFVVCLCVWGESLAHAEDLAFHLIFPDNRNPQKSAELNLKNFHQYLQETLNHNVTGTYFSDAPPALKALQSMAGHFALMSPDFFETYKKRFGFRKILLTIPAYSTGPYENFFIMAHKDVNLIEFMEKKAQIELYAATSYDKGFLKNVIFDGNKEIQQISWTLQKSEDLPKQVQKIIKGDRRRFVLLTAYEFSIIKKLKRRNPAFDNLKLMYTSKPFPSLFFVSIGKTSRQLRSQIKAVLQGMSRSLKGNVILKRLRLKDFVGPE